MWFRTFAIAALCVAPAGAQTIVNIQDYFILMPESFWHYTGEGQPGSSIDDDFSWQVLDQMPTIGGEFATQIETFSDEQTDFRHLDRDFWLAEPDGDLFLLGFHNGTADTGFPVQDVILDEPFLMGTDGVLIGQQFSATVTADVMSSLGSSATIQLTVTYNAILPSVDTPMGTFLDCLQLIIDVSVVSVETGFGQVPVDLPIITSEFILKEGVGMVMHDQNADPDDAEIQAADLIIVGGDVIAADVPSGGGASPLDFLLEILLGTLGANSIFDFNSDGVNDAADVVTAVNAMNGGG